VSGLFTTEFYGRMRRYLAPGAVFGQWLQTYELDDELVESVLAALHQNFADYRVFMIDSGDLLIVASSTGPLPRPDWSVTGLPEIRKDLCRFLPVTGLGLARTLVLDRAGFAPLMDRGLQPNSDFYPILDLGAERVRFLQHTAVGVGGLAGGVLDFIGDPALRPTDWDPAASSALLQTPRVVSLLRAARIRRLAPDSAWSTGSAEPQRYLRQTWSRQTVGSGDSAPESWRSWIGDFWQLRGWLHGGGAPADSGFFAEARRYVERAGAPAPVRAAVAFGEALARRDMAAAARATGPLLDEARAKRNWIPADDVLDGAVLALLATGQADRAREAYDVVRPFSTRRSDDLRLALLQAYIAAAQPRAP
jgi:hypothetical protein